MADTNLNGTVLNSNFSYEPPVAAASPEESDEFSQSVKDVISEIEGEFNQNEAEEVLGEDGLPIPPEVEPTTEDRVEPVEPVQDDPAVMRGLDRLVQRETAQQAKEAAFQAREAQVSRLEKENADLRGKMPQADMVDKLWHSPSAVLKELGHDPKVVVRLMIAEQLKEDGQEIPPALQDYVKKAAEIKADKARDAEVAGLKAQLADRQRQETATAYFNGIALGAQEYVKGLTDPKKTVENGKKFPTFAELVKANSDRAHREVLGEITRDAQSRMATDPNGDPLTFEEAAKRVEARLSDMKSLLVQTNPGATQARPGQKILPTQTKAPARPLKPWEAKSDDIYKQGIDDAVREFYKSEQARLAQRKG